MNAILFRSSVRFSRQGNTAVLEAGSAAESCSRLRMYMLLHRLTTPVVRISATVVDDTIVFEPLMLSFPGGACVEGRAVLGVGGFDTGIRGTALQTILLHL